MKVFKAVKSGRAWNGAHRDSGTIVHLITSNDFPSWSKALCGVEPGIRGNGWHYPTDFRPVTCEKCAKKAKTDNGKEELKTKSDE